MKNIAKKLSLLFLDFSGINSLCRVINRRKAIILFYHGVCDDNFELLKDYDERHIPKSLFKKQIKFLIKSGYHPVSMTELVNSLKNKKDVGKFAVLTFDDGFKNVVDNAYPIMKELGAKGCFYLVSDLIGSSELVWTDFVETVIRNQEKGDFPFFFEGEKINYRLKDRSSYEQAMRDIKAKLRSLPDKKRREHLKQLQSYNLTVVPSEFLLASWEQIREMDPDIMEIGGHTKSHPDCANLTTDQEIEDEIYHSKIDIENRIGRNISHFCYPNGNYNAQVIGKLMKYGYESAVARLGFTEQDSNLYTLERIDPGENYWLFKARISGSNNIIKKLKSLF